MTKKKPPPAKKSAPRAAEGYRPFQALKGLSQKLERDATSAAEAPARKAAAPRPPPAAPPDSPHDDALAFHRMMSGVTPLGEPARRIPRSADALPESRLDQRRAASDAHATEEAEAVRAQLRALVEGGPFEVEDDGHSAEGRRAGVAHDVVRRLRRGQYPIDARLDLHGLRAEEARDALERFLGDKRARGERCVLVVHGKGTHSVRGVGVLRGEIAAWLSQGAASVHVEAFATAQPEDGGQGAVYVLLVK